MNLKQVFESITPENIKDIPLIKTAMDIFIANLKKNSNISLNINKVYQNILDGSGSISDNSKSNLKNAMLDTYLSETHNTIKSTQNDIHVQKKYEELGLTDAPINNDSVKILNSEHFFTNRFAKQNIGTKTGFEYVYELAKYLEDNTDESEFEIRETGPFHIQIYGAITSEMYNALVSKLAHPLGFTYSYNKVISENITDLYGLSAEYLINDIEIRELNGTIDVFSSDSNIDNVKLDFISRGYTSTSFDAAVLSGDITVHLNKDVVDIYEDSIGNSDTKTIKFSDNSYIKQTLNPLNIEYKNSLDQDLKTFDGHFSLFLDYTINYNVQYTDNADFGFGDESNDNFDISNPAVVFDDFSADVYSDSANYMNTTDNYYLVTGDGLDASNQHYLFAI